jgi:hypothetical protein
MQCKAGNPSMGGWLQGCGAVRVLHLHVISTADGGWNRVEHIPRKENRVQERKCRWLHQATALGRAREKTKTIKPMPSPAEIACPVASRIQALSATHSTGRSTLLPGPNAMAFRLTLVLFAVLAPVQAALFLR